MRAARTRASWTRSAALCSMLVGLALAAVACTPGSSSSGDAAPANPAAAAPTVDPSTAPAGEPTGGQSAAGGGAAESAPAPGSDSRQLATVPVDGSKVIRTADLSIRLNVDPVPVTDDAAADRDANAKARSDAVAATATTVRGIATTAGGFQASADGGGSQMTIALRVPADQYDAVMDKLTVLGELTNRTESSQDVTAQLVDVNSRVDSMTASVARVRALLAQATSIADIISIESELSTREADLESLQQQQAYLNGQVAMSTITLGLTAFTITPPTPDPVPDNGFVAGIKSGWAALIGFGSWIGGAVGAVLPFLPIIVLAALVIWLAVRRLHHHGPASNPVDARGVVPTVPGGLATPPEEAVRAAEPVPVGPAPLGE